MSADEQRIAAFLLALRQSEKRLPHGSSGGYVEHLDANDDEGVVRQAATIDGWWTVEQLTYAINAATPTPAPRRRWADDPRWWNGALTAGLVLWLGDLIWGMLT